MTNSATAPQIPQHVSALLSHLTSRPGVQSTLILSRTDGSIIQTTGLLAPAKRTLVSSGASNPAPAPRTESAATDTPTDTATETATPSSPSTEAETQQLHSSSIASAQTQNQAQTQSNPYQPTQAEALAARIFALVSAASNLGLSLSNPPGQDADDNGVQESGLINGSGNGNGTGSGGGRDEGETEGSEGQDDDGVKLLRLRTKKHEVVVVPDRKYLLCVVQDATLSAAGSSGGSASGNGGLGTGRLSR
ncbi:hypothetical protein BDW66DRAFT_153926 [Aspergillus desertorum]